MGHRDPPHRLFRAVRGRPMTPGHDARKRWWALLVLCLGVLMIVLDTTIVNVALPSIRADLGFTRDLAGLGDQRLHAHLRRLPAAGRPARRPVRPPQAVPGRHHAVHARLAGLRPGAIPGAAGGRPRSAGPGRRSGVRGGAVADHESLSRTRGAGQGHGRVRFRVRGRRQHRRAAGRPADRCIRLALDIPGEPADRHRRVNALPDADTGPSGTGRPAPGLRRRLSR